MSTRRTPEQVIADLRAIVDPRERVEAAAAAVRKHEEREQRARVLRDAAAASAHLDQGVKPVEIYRDVLGCSRTLFNRMVKRAQEEGSAREKIANALMVAADSAAAVQRSRLIVEGAREVRDEASLTLMSEATSNAEVARLTGLSTARIAQVRTGTR